MEKQDVLGVLKKTALFKGLSQAKLKVLSGHFEGADFKKGEVIFNEGEKGSTLHIIKSGKVKIIKYTKDGRLKTLAVLKETDSFGEMAVLTKEARSATVEALDKVETIAITKDAFENIIKKEPSISLQIIKTLSERLAKANIQIKILALGNAKARVANVVIDIIENMKNIKFTHKEIADLAGITRETTTRILKKMEKDGIIEVKGRTVRILLPDKLKAFCL